MTSVLFHDYKSLCFLPQDHKNIYTHFLLELFTALFFKCFIKFFSFESLMQLKFISGRECRFIYFVPISGQCLNLLNGILMFIWVSLKFLHSLLLTCVFVPVPYYFNYCSCAIFSKVFYEATPPLLVYFFPLQKFCGYSFIFMFPCIYNHFFNLSPKIPLNLQTPCGDTDMFTTLLTFYLRARSLSLRVFKSMVKSLLWVLQPFPCRLAHFPSVSHYDFVIFVDGTLFLVFKSSCF